MTGCFNSETPASIDFAPFLDFTSTNPDARPPENIQFMYCNIDDPTGEVLLVFACYHTGSCLFATKSARTRWSVIPKMQLFEYAFEGTPATMLLSASYTCHPRIPYTHI